ncbi:MAG: OmpA family protein [Bacteroidia bacterium]
MPFAVSAAGPKLREADSKFASGHYYDALQLYQSARDEKNSKEEKAYTFFQIAECYRKLNQMEEAEMYYKRSISSGYNNSIVYLRQAQAMQYNGKYSEAILAFEDYLKLQPGSFEAQNGINSCKLSLEWMIQEGRWKIENNVQINSRDDDYCPAWADKRKSILVFTSRRPGQSGVHVDPLSGAMFSDLFQTKVDNKGKWSVPVKLGGAVNSPVSNDGSANLDQSGNKIYFTRCDKKKRSGEKCKIYYAEKRGDSWSAPVLITFGLQKTHLDSFNFRHPSVSSNGKVMVFSSDMGGGAQPNSDLWISYFDVHSKTWGLPVKMGTNINTSGREGFPYIHEDGTLYFASDGHPGMGGLDIFSCGNVNDKESLKTNPVNLKSPFNSSADDFGIIFDPKKKRGYLTSNRNGTKGGDDIWTFSLSPCGSFVEGMVYSCEGNKPVKNARVYIECSCGSFYKCFTNDTGYYSFKIGDERNFKITVMADSANVVAGQSFLNADSVRTFTTIRDINDCSNFRIDFCWPPLTKEEIKMPVILYEYNSAELLPQSKDSLNYLYDILIRNPSLVIEIGAHTDSRGSSDYNRKLSQARAQSCANYLVREKGIAPERIIAKGYGEDRPLKLPDGIVLTEKYILSKKSIREQESLHLLNRRTVFKVVRTDYLSEKDKNTNQPVILKGYFDETGDQVSAEE